MHNTFNRSSATILTVSIVLALLFVLNYSAAQWTDAPANPPNNNVAAPINVGPQNQEKYVAPADKTEDNHGIIGANEFIGFERIRTNQYCDLSGENCSSAAGGGAWDFVSDPIVYEGAGQNYVIPADVSGPNAQIQVDLVALSNTGGFSRGDVIHNITSVTNGIADTYRNQDSGVLVYSDVNGNVIFHVHSMGIMITPPSTFRGGQALQAGQWAIVVKVKKGTTYNGALPASQTCNAYGCS